jgi:hypothetical protein
MNKQAITCHGFKWQNINISLILTNVFLLFNALFYAPNGQIQITFSYTQE